MPKMIAPANAGDTCGHEGQTYKIENGVVDLPPNAAAALASHGFEPWAPTAGGAAAPIEGNPDQVASTLATDRDAALRSIEVADRELLLKMCESVGVEVLKGHTDTVLRRKLVADLDRRWPPVEPPKPVDGTIDLRAAASAAPVAAVKPVDPDEAAFGPKSV